MKAYKIVYLPIVIVLLFGITSCLSVKPIEFVRVNSFKIAENTVKKGLLVTTNLTLYNPNKMKVNITSSDIDVYAEGVNLGKLKIPENLEIKPKTEFSCDFELEIGLSKLLMAGKNVLAKFKSGKFEVNLKGTMEADFLLKHKIVQIDYIESIDLK